MLYCVRFQLHPNGLPDIPVLHPPQSGDVRVKIKLNAALTHAVTVYCSPAIASCLTWSYNSPQRITDAERFDAMVRNRGRSVVVGRPDGRRRQRQTGVGFIHQTFSSPSYRGRSSVKTCSRAKNTPRQSIVRHITSWPRDQLGAKNVL